MLGGFYFGDMDYSDDDSYYSEDDEEGDDDGEVNIHPLNNCFIM